MSHGYAGAVFAGPGSQQPMVKKASYGFYVYGLGQVHGLETRQVGLYLHNDGLWRHNTANESSTLTGYFDTESEAQAALDRWLGKK